MTVIVWFALHRPTWGDVLVVRSSDRQSESGRVRTAIGTYSIHQIAPQFFSRFETSQAEVRLATPEKALLDLLYLTPARSRLFARLPEIELPARFSVRECRRWIARIPASYRRTMVRRRLEALLADADRPSVSPEKALSLIRVALGQAPFKQRSARVSTPLDGAAKSSEQHAHRYEFATQWIEHHAETLERHRSEQRLVVRLPEHHRRRCAHSADLEVCFTDAAFETACRRRARTRFCEEA